MDDALLLDSLSCLHVCCSMSHVLDRTKWKKNVRNESAKSRSKSDNDPKNENVVVIIIERRIVIDIVPGVLRRIEEVVDRNFDFRSTTMITIAATIDGVVVGQTDAGVIDRFMLQYNAVLLGTVHFSGGWWYQLGFG